MSVYIRNIEMPKVCDDCWALDDNYDYPRCRITDEQRGYNFNCRERRMDRCPLVPVPEHGPLIDADLLVKVLKRCSEDEWNKETRPFSWSYAYECVTDVVEGMPTIIPADKEET